MLVLTISHLHPKRFKKIISEFLIDQSIGSRLEAGRVLLWPRPDREATLIAPLYLFFIYQQNKKIKKEKKEGVISPDILHEIMILSKVHFKLLLYFFLLDVNFENLIIGLHILYILNS